jgi:hypothetical protein
MSDAEQQQSYARYNPDTVAKVRQQLGRIKSERDAAITERNAARVERDALKTENDRLKIDVDSDKNKKRVIELEGKLREIEYRKVFDRIAKAKGIREDACDAAYQLGGYKPPDGEVDETVLGAAIDEQKTRQTFLTGKVEESSAPLPESQQRKPGPASGQGSKASSPQGFVLPADTDARWSDTVWQWNHRKEIAAAIAEKRANGIV